MLHLIDTSNVTGYTDTAPASVMSLTALTKPVFYTGKDMNEEKDSLVFLVDLIDSLDKVMVNDDLSLSTVEQRELFKQYLVDADTGLQEQILLQLDEYLGGYLGEENDVYFRHVYRMKEDKNVGESNE